jgi:hypothetical protein
MQLAGESVGKTTLFKPIHAYLQMMDSEAAVG